MSTDNIKKEEYYCNECMYSKIPFWENLIYTLTFQDKTYSYYCTKFSTILETSSSNRKVVRPKIKRTLNKTMCYIARKGECPNGKFWFSNKKKDLFKLLRKD